MTNYTPVFFDIETTGLNPMAQSWWNGVEHDARVICVGIGTVKDWRGSLSSVEKHVTVFSFPSEYEMLEVMGDLIQEFVEEVHGNDIHEKSMEFFLVGWNNRTFDHPYYGARCARLRLDPYPIGYGWKRLDCMRVARNMTGRYWKEDDWIEDKLGTRAEDDITGKDVPNLFGQGRIDKIKKHCNADVKDLIDIFLHDREPMMGEFYRHYGINKTPVFLEEVGEE